MQIIKRVMVGLFAALAATSAMAASAPWNGTFAGWYSDTTTYPDAFTHVENNLVTSSDIAGTHVFYNNSGASGVFTWAGAVGAFDGDTLHFAGAGTIYNLGVRSFTLGNSGIYLDEKNSRFVMYWNGTDSVYGAIGGISYKTADLAAAGVAAVPEPEAYAMLLVGLGLVGGIARRRKQLR